MSVTLASDITVPQRDKQAVTDRLIKITTALAVLAVAGVAAIISYQHGYQLVSSHGESGVRRS